MPPMKKAFVTLAAATVLLSACGAAPSKPNPTEATQTPPASGTQTATGSAYQPPAPAAPAQMAAQADSASKKPDAEVKKEYHMNKNYDIVPNDASGNKKVVLLTFDDGPKQMDMNKALLDTLDKHKAKAIFFLNGYNIKAHPDLLKYILDRGGIIGNHAWDHIDLKKASNEKVDQQIDDVVKIMKEQIGQTPQFFRPPFGIGSDYLKEKVKKQGMLYMTWSNGSKDWEMTIKKNDPNAVVQNVLDQLHNGSNILMHELPWTCEALDNMLTQLEAKGYSFVDPRAIELEMR